ncbi:MAG: sulfate adenylyltransferase subunit CysD [Planctomycetota bacterium]
MDRLAQLEHQSVYILREAFARLERLAMLWSIGKDSTVLLWLARKAFGGHVPFPLVHIDTSFKIPEMIAYRDRMVAEWQLDLRVVRNESALAAGMNHERGRVTCCHALKTQPLEGLLRDGGYRGLIVGVRKDEQQTRAKERTISLRGADLSWAAHDQAPELWGQFNTDLTPGTHARVHPLLDWTEINVWEYIERESIPVLGLYFARNGHRYRSLGCAPCTAPVASRAETVEQVIAELRDSRASERDGRAQDLETEDAFERLRRDGYL